MTGFGRCEVSSNAKKIIVEMKAVNHRYLDVNMKLPKKLSFFEAALRNILKEYASRGKVDIYVSYENQEEGIACVHYNETIAKEYYTYLKQMCKTFSMDEDIRATYLARMPEVFTLEEQEEDEDTLWNLLEEAFRGACVKFRESRGIEGENLCKDIQKKLSSMLSNVDEIEKRSPVIVKEYREKLLAKVEELLASTTMDESRIATEVTIFADKICVDEETVRLRSHIASVEQELLRGGAVGRKLDFLAQEMNREANTILSKANDISISDYAIDLKTEIERVREQIQNLE